MSESHPSAARLLLRLKWRGFWRKQWRRVRTPSGALLALLGGALAVLWLASLSLPMFRRGPTRLGADDAELLAQFALAVIVVIALSTSFSFRGLYVPAGEIETLFSAPLSRPTLIRLRLAVALARSALGASFAGLGATRLGGSPHYAFAGAFTAFLWAPILGQGVAIALGGAENRLAARVARAPHRALRMALFAGLLLGFLSLLSHDPRASDLPERAPLEYLRQLAENPLVAAFLAPFWPWARAVSATGPSEFWPAFALCLAIVAATLAVVANLRVDFRETALATSADMARRLARMSRGLGAGGVEARRLPLAWRTPWLFGRGPFGAVAFRKTASILRRARGGVLFGCVVIAAVTLFASQWLDPAGGGFQSALLVTAFGAFYLSLGLRYDFREELDTLPAIRAWPLAPWKIFLATIAPQIGLISVLVAAGAAFTLWRAGELDLRFAALAMLIGLLVATWVGIDNLAFLLAPTRAAPGHDGVLQHMGRSIVLALLRSLTMAAALAAAAAPVLICVQLLGWSLQSALPWGLLGAAGVLVVEVAALVAAGGLALARFDVARER